MELEKIGVNPRKIGQFINKGILTVEDLLSYLPKKYYNFSILNDPRAVNNKDIVSFLVQIEGCEDRTSRNGIPMTEIKVIERSGYHITILYYHQQYLSHHFTEKSHFIFAGPVNVEISSHGVKFITMINPLVFKKVENPNDPHEVIGLYPVYSKIKGMSDDYLKKYINEALSVEAVNKDYLPSSFCDGLGLNSRCEAYKKIHNPQSPEDISQAKKRLLFDDLFYFNWILYENSLQNIKTVPYQIKSLKLTNKYINSLPFVLTRGQVDAITSLHEQAKEGKRIYSLLQADVGYGKTEVAKALSLMCVDNGLQTVILTPTSLLASQHYHDFMESFRCLSPTPEAGQNNECNMGGSPSSSSSSLSNSDDFGPYGWVPQNTSQNAQNRDIRDVSDSMTPTIALLTSATKKRERGKILVGLKDGSINILIATHAALADDIEYNNLGAIIVDEEHRFGVTQRDKLLKKYQQVHHLSMSATPIPRTLAIALYGENIDILSITTPPLNRKTVRTVIARSDDSIHQSIEQTLDRKEKIYVVCAMIDENDERPVKSLEETYHEMVRMHPTAKVAQIHGKTKTAEKDEILKDFAEGDIDILVATTVVEVGVNVPNATLMVIENAECFGLAQLHQLRGRVGRSTKQSYCVLRSDREENSKAYNRLKVLVDTNDGFKVAEADLQQRGAGDFIGTTQSGEDKYVGLMLGYPKMNEKVKEIVRKVHDQGGELCERLGEYFAEERERVMRG